MTVAFVVTAPTLWNMHPSSVRLVGNIDTFVRHLEAYHYNLAYPPWLIGVTISPLSTGIVY